MKPHGFPLARWSALSNGAKAFKLAKLLRNYLTQGSQEALSEYSTLLNHSVSLVDLNFPKEYIDAYHYLNERATPIGPRDFDLYIDTTTSKNNVITDRTTPLRPTIPWAIALDNLRSAHNTGSAFRIADAFGFSNLLLLGTTPVPSHAGLARAARGSEKWMQWKKIHSLEELLAENKLNIPMVALEITEHAIPIEKFAPPAEGILIVGNEKRGVGSELLSKCSEVVTIPMCGRKHSLNVSTALAICTYHIRQNWEKAHHLH